MCIYKTGLGLVSVLFSFLDSYNMNVNIKSLSMLFCFFLVLSACASSSSVAGHGSKIIGNIRFFPQEDHQCGPASLAGVLDYWGLHISPEEIAGEIFSKSAGGTLNLDMGLYAQRKGCYSLAYSGGMADLREKIDAGYPLVVMVDNGISVWQVIHFMVVTGYNEDSVIVNSGKREHEVVDNDRFIKSWSKTNYWSLLVYKK
jgi:hypothetical protein